MKDDHDLIDALHRLSPKHREALLRVAKTQARAFFRNPHAMIALRRMVECQD